MPTDPTAALQEALKAHYRAVGSHGTPGASCGAPECADAIVTILGKRGVILTLSTPQADDTHPVERRGDLLVCTSCGAVSQADDPGGPPVVEESELDNDPMALASDDYYDPSGPDVEAAWADLWADPDMCWETVTVAKAAIARHRKRIEAAIRAAEDETCDRCGRSLESPPCPEDS